MQRPVAEKQSLDINTYSALSSAAAAVLLLLLLLARQCRPAAPGAVLARLCRRATCLPAGPCSFMCRCRPPWLAAGPTIESLAHCSVVVLALFPFSQVQAALAGRKSPEFIEADEKLREARAAAQGELMRSKARHA